MGEDRVKDLIRQALTERLIYTEPRNMSFLDGYFSWDEDKDKKRSLRVIYARKSEN